MDLLNFDFIGTLTPNNLELLPSLGDAGLDRGRIPERYFTSLDELAAFVERIDQVAPDFPLSIDLRGAKNTFTILNAHQPLHLQKDAGFVVCFQPGADVDQIIGESQLPVLVPRYYPQKPPKRLFFKDGEVGCDLIDVYSVWGTYQVAYGCVDLRDQNGIHFGSVDVDVPKDLLPEDREFLEGLSAHPDLERRFDEIIISFVEGPQIIYEAREVAPEHSRIIAKLESGDLQCLGEVLQVLKQISGGIAVAEGDGALAWGDDLHIIRCAVLEVAAFYGVPAYVYTLLSSMKNRPVPTASDRHSFQHAVRLGARGVLISDPLNGPYALEAVVEAVELAHVAMAPAEVLFAHQVAQQGGISKSERR